MTDGLMPGTRHEWPAGHRAAVAILVAIEDPVAASPDATPDTGIDYAATGMQRLLDVLADLDTSVTTCWTESAMNSLPQLVRRVADSGHEVAVSFETGDSAAPQPNLVPSLQRVSGQPVLGGITSSQPEQTASLQWIIDGSNGDIPSMIGGESTPIVRIPISPYWNDRTWLHPDRPLPPSSLLEAWSASLAEVRTNGSLMTVIIHPHIMMRPGFTATFIRFLDEAIAAGDTWLTRIDHLALWWSQHQSQT